MKSNGGKGKGWFTRWIIKPRGIDRLVAEVDEKLKFELHSSFQWAVDITSMLIIMVPVYLNCYNYIHPTKLIVAVGTISEATYNDIWENKLHWTVGPLMQFTGFWIWYDATALLRYWIFARIYGPLWKRMGWLRPATPGNASSTMRRPVAATTVGGTPAPGGLGKHHHQGTASSSLRVSAKKKAFPKPLGTTTAGPAQETSALPRNRVLRSRHVPPTAA